MKRVLRLGGVATGIVMCLMVTSCRTVQEPRILTFDGTSIPKNARQATVAPTIDLKNQLITREYFLSSWAHGTPVSGTERASTDVEFKRWYSELGVSWPDGSSLTFQPILRIMSVTNTRENLNRIETVLAMAGMGIPKQVEIDFQIVAFRTKDIEKLQLGGGMTKEALFDLRRAGKGKLVGTSSVVTQNGSEGTMKTVQEVIYPTEFPMDGVVCESNQVSQCGALVPAGFAMREVGMILQVIPELTPNGKLINVTLVPAWVTLDRWESYPANMASEGKHKAVPFRQPVFGVTSFSTRVQVENGGTVLIGSSLTPDGEQVNVGFLTVRLREVLK